MNTRVAHVVGFAMVVLAGAVTPAVAQSVQEPIPAAPAQSPAPAPQGPFAHLQIGVALEGYYQFNRNRPFDRVNLLRAYDTRSNVFSLQQAAIVIESAPSVANGRRFGGRVDLQFGQATETVQGNAANEPRPDTYRHLWQAYGTYIFPVGRGLQADFGKFGSNLGYETNYAKDNHHFSRALLFNFLPFYHMGLRLTLPLSDSVTVMYMLTNGVQQAEDFNNSKSRHVTAVVTPVSGLTWTTSFYRGQEQPDGEQPNGPDGVFRVIDSYVSWVVSPAVSLGLDINHVENALRQSDEALTLQGTAVYARYQVSAPLALAVRYERLDDDGLFGGVAQRLHEVTLTAEHELDEGFLIRAELRRDWSNVAFFTGRTQTDRRTSQPTALLGLVWHFGNKSGTW